MRIPLLVWAAGGGGCEKTTQHFLNEGSCSLFPLTVESLWEYVLTDSTIFQVAGLESNFGLTFYLSAENELVKAASPDNNHANDAG